MAKRDEYLSQIRRMLGAFLSEIALDSGVNRLGLNITAEDIFCGLLNILYDYELVNANQARQNQSAVDLVDEANGIAVQVTSTNTKQKVQHTLENFCKGIEPERLCDRYDQLIVLILIEKGKFKGSGEITSDDTDLRIMCVGDLYKEIMGKGLKKQKEILDYLDQELGSLFDGAAVSTPTHLLPTELPASGSFVPGSRDKELARLIPAVESGDPVLIWGLGGMGKTQVAIQIAKQMAPPKGAYFLRYALPVDGAGEAMRETILQANFTDYRYDGPDRDEDYRARLDILRKEYAGALLIVDNFDWPGKNLDDLRGEASFRDLTQTGVRLVLTTRYPVDNEDWKIGPISEDDLLKLMRASYKDAEVFDEELLALIREVDGHTLMVDLMAKTLERSRGGLTPEVLLEDLRRNDLDQKHFPRVTSDQNLKFAQEKIYGHLRTLFDLSGMDEGCRTVLRYATLLPEGGMDYSLFRDCLTYPSENPGFIRRIGNALFRRSRKRTVLSDSLQKLVDAGWLQYANKLLTIHPVVREVCWEELEPTDEKCKDFLNRLWNRFDLQKEYDAIQFRQIAWCFSAASDMLADKTGDWSLLAGRFWDLVGVAQMALTYELRMVERCEENLSPDSLDLATAYNNVGSTYGDLGDHTNALEYKLKALHIWEKVLSSDHPDLATGYDNVGVTYGDQGDHFKALEYQMKALHIRKNVLPSNHLDLAISYDNVGVTYGEQGDHSKALEYKLKALHIREKVLPSDHPDLARNCNNVGLTYGALGVYSKALEYQLKALRIWEKVLPSDHPDLATCYDNVGIVYSGLGDHFKALEYQLKAQHIREKVLPGAHPDLANSYNNLGITYFCMGDFEKSLTFLEKALAICIESLPAGHPYAESTKENIALIKEVLATQEDATS